MERHSNGATIAAGLLMTFQAFAGGLAGLALLASARRLQRFTLASGVAHHRTDAGLIIIAVAVAAIVVAGFMISGSSTARIFAYALEALAIISAMLRLGHHPAIAIASVAIAVVVIVLLAMDTDTGAESDARTSGGPAPGVGGTP